MAQVDFDRVIGIPELRKLTFGQVRVYHVGNLARDRFEGTRPIPAIDRKANVALHHAKHGTGALFQRCVGDGEFEYLIIGTGFMPELHSYSSGF